MSLFFMQPMSCLMVCLMNKSQSVFHGLQTQSTNSVWHVCVDETIGRGFENISTCCDSDGKMRLYRKSDRFGHFVSLCVFLQTWDDYQSYFERESEEQRKNTKVSCTPLTIFFTVELHSEDQSKLWLFVASLACQVMSFSWKVDLTV